MICMSFSVGGVAGIFVLRQPFVHHRTVAGPSCHKIRRIDSSDSVGLGREDIVLM
jgi:hypothetical protein